MARIPQVTRTFTTTKATVMVADVTQQEMYNVECILPRTFSDKKALMKAAKNAVETDDGSITVVAIVSTEEIVELRAMSEADFLKYSHKIEPRKGKIVEDPVEAY